MVKPFVPRNIVKKRTKKFTRHRCELFPQLSSSWRKPRGEDSPVRRRYKGQKAMPNKGYGSDRRTKYITPSGFKNFPVNNVQDLYMLLMQNRKYAGVISHTVGAKARKAIVRKAHELDVRLINGNAKLRRVDV
ncbi:60S ribosomal protein L32, putative [Trypanosoma equiperdum]|uniref:60S ribosomal protein L32, putative n=4 Tax=Trypanozoon TaxID=39700 RepID=Q38CL1_TRYB2|nr:60S ribosomal protein L32, putative [Trypanosoma brucei gambiense DAL972]XP_822287.1 60S ribosomal protein L32, putative [Trypanosoma brucei brucei TREU927]4V8M_Bi Chain Bi, 60S RIBOSOMAL PROTEIN L32, PUTATIVE [Trypanosoma brucei brucei TREU927]8OVA_Bi Chain Bi, 60S ribosomal protein L32, putative [Trypanosoma brucei brucei]8OVE_Bi Chain Bi, 60S ribosomal protein L32, putative [Trypanosoma brucei brucei]RHW69923.1 60S ribosomal protein L32 [Trypanosoma brucei equiperdum]SCU67056.1 60S ribo|eukprot:XP_011777203.1 60S ribosomal protein L32, putative [Trypanosoma brucei gambiense DAL972]